MEAEWSCYSSGHYWKENGYLKEVVNLVEGEWLCYRGCQFNGGRKVMLGGQFNGGRMVML